MQVNLAEVSQDLVQLVEAALHGEEIIILKEDKPVVKLTPVEPVRRRPAKAGSAKGLIWMSDDFDKPLEEMREYME
ncbi:MAG: DUF2281 domain-containing protein [Cyanobacteria bacterium P01_A01_bin.123]